MTQLPPEDLKRIMLSFLTKSNHLLLWKLRKAPAETMIFATWFDILAKSRLWIEDEAEVISFLYFIMAMIIQSWNDYIANDWDGEQMLVDFDYKAKWLRKGLRQNN